MPPAVVRTCWPLEPLLGNGCWQSDGVAVNVANRRSAAQATTPNELYVFENGLRARNDNRRNESGFKSKPPPLNMRRPDVSMSDHRA